MLAWQWNKIGEKISRKSLTMPKKLKGGTLWDFSTSILSQNIKKLKGDPLGKFFSKKSLTMPKKLKTGMVWLCYAEKEENPFWFTSLGQMMQFGTIKFTRTFLELFWSVHVDWKKKSHYNSRVSLHEAPTKNTVWSWTNQRLLVQFCFISWPLLGSYMIIIGHIIIFSI